MNTQTKTLRSLLERELQRQNDRPTHERVAETIFGFYLDNSEQQKIVLAALKTLQQHTAYGPALKAAKNILSFNVSANPNFSIIRGQARDRRASLQQSALDLASTQPVRLLHLPARNLRLALQAATSAQATALIEAWNALSLYEQTHT